jgi:CubicO group peptidase (beta-lactamase class C family)
MTDSIANQVNMNKLPQAILQLLNERIGIAVQTGIAPSVALAIFHYDTPILEAAWGWLDPDERTMPTQTSTLFDLASVTKLYTIVSFLSLVSDESVGLHTPLVNLIPEFAQEVPRGIDGGQDPHSKQHLPTPDDLKGQMVDPKQVTCFHLLTHTSGLPAWRDVYTIADAPLAPPQPDPLTRQERWKLALERLCSYNFVGLPDSIIRYSDIGIMLIGEVVSRLHSQSGELDKAIKDRILGDRFPNTTFNPMYNGFERESIAPTEYDATWRKRRVWGEVHDENSNGIGGVAGHAGLFSTAFEVALFGNVWLNHSGKLLKIDPELAGAAVELQAQTGTEVRGLGWMLKSPKNSAAGDVFSPASYGHTGFTGTSLWIDPREKLVVAIMTNRVYPGREQAGIHDLRRDIHDIIAEWVQA